MKKTIITLLLGVVLLRTQAQSPEFYPPVDPEPVEFDLFHILLYIVMPLLLIFFYFLYRRSKKKKERQKERNKEAS